MKKTHNELKSKLKQMRDVDRELRKVNYDSFVGLKVKISKKYSNWIKNNAKDIGMPYKEERYLSNQPKGTIQSCRYDDIVNGFSFLIEFPNGLTERVGLKDFIIL